MEYPNCKVERIGRLALIGLLEDSYVDHLWVNSEFLAKLKGDDEYEAEPQENDEVAALIDEDCQKLRNIILDNETIANDSPVVEMVLKTLDQARKNGNLNANDHQFWRNEPAEEVERPAEYIELDKDGEDSVSLETFETAEEYQSLSSDGSSTELIDLVGQDSSDSEDEDGVDEIQIEEIEEGKGARGEELVQPRAKQKTEELQSLQGPETETSQQNEEAGTINQPLVNEAQQKFDSLVYDEENLSFDELSFDSDDYEKNRQEDNNNLKPFDDAAVATYVTPDETEATLDKKKAKKLKTRKKRARSKSKVPRMVKQLSCHIRPGLLEVGVTPKLFKNQLDGTVDLDDFRKRIIGELGHLFPEYRKELGLSRGRSHKTSNKILKGEPERVEAGYYKAHASDEVAEMFAGCLPKELSVKKAAPRKAIVFASTLESKSDTHYDQDTSFLLVLQGRKEIMLAPPSMGKKLDDQRVVDSHSSIFEDVDPFGKDSAGWEKKVIETGDGLLLPQRWLHCVASVTGTLAISLQVVSNKESSRLASPLTRFRSRPSSPSLGQAMGEAQAPKAKRSRTSSPALGRALVDAFRPASKITRKDPPPTTNRVAPSSKKNSVSTRIANETKNQLPNSSSAQEKKGTANGPSPPAGAEPRDSSFTEQIQTKVQIDPSPKTLATKKSRKTKQASSDASFVRRSRREKYQCGKEGCRNGFHACQGQMWTLVLKEWDLVEDPKLNIPVVPTYHPKHLLCLECMNNDGDNFMEPEDVLDLTERREIKRWNEYRFYLCTKLDYLRWSETKGKGALWQNCPWKDPKEKVQKVE